MKQKKNHFTFITTIQPPFVDIDKPDEAFYPSIGYNFTSGDINPGWCFISKETEDYQQFPFYAACIQKSGEATFIVSGGAYIGESGIASSNYCFRMAINDHMDGIRLRFEHDRLGLVREDDKGNEVQDKVSVIPQMNYPRHNHKIFELQNPNHPTTNMYLVVGGLFCESDTWNVLSTCELYDEKQSINEKGEQNWETVGELSIARTGFSGFVLNNKVYIFGGQGAKNNELYLLNTKDVECFDVNTKSWTQIKFKWGLGINNNLSACCLPVSQSQVLIFGGANGEKATDKISIMDIDRKVVENNKSKSKLSVPRAGAQLLLLRQVDVSDSTQKKDVIVILGGNQDEVSFDYFAIKNWNTFELEYLGKNEFNNAFTGAITGTYSYQGMNDIKAWTQTMLALPVVTLIQ